ncbi:MAG TPA: aromatic amino acid ammonia-lyase [Candidatus Paceibacterota bacterium]|nr:aromatic amino acid ammonia-lyase [Candidatus Paceibacterota bacterium]
MKLLSGKNHKISSKKIRRILIDGYSLTPTQVYTITQDASIKIAIDPIALDRMRRSREFLLDAARKQAIYGVNTGFGPMVTHIIGIEHVTELQYNLLRGHANGMGDPVRSEYVLAAMLVRLNTIIRGDSGVSVELAHTLCACVNARITPIVPEHGAVGTSGDLVQLAHIALLLIGEGDVMYKGKRTSAALALKDVGIKAHILGAKEGLSLINGTSMMSGIGCILLIQARRALSLAMRTGAISFELVNGFTDVIDSRLHVARPHFGQETVARILRELTKDSKLLSDREKFAHAIKIGQDVQVTNIVLQEVYSIRCIPQILGPIMETLLHAEEVITVEINSTTDNPIVDVEKSRFIHGGNFHGDYVATAIDQLKAGIIKMTLLSERRINFFLNKNINKTFPPFLNLETPGLTMGLQGLQFVATSTAAQSQSFGYPHSLHSIPTNGDNQDVVSMGTDAALIASKVIENAFIVLAIEVLTLSQAAATFSKTEKIDGKFSSQMRQLLQKIRTHAPLVKKDRILSYDMEKLCTALTYDESLDFT